MHGIKDGLTERKGLDTMSLRKMYVNSLLLEKTCRKCKKTFPRNKEYFYPRKEINGTRDGYEATCIACENKRTFEWKEKNKDSKRKADFIYKNSENGYFKEMWQGVKKSIHGCEFKSYDEFYDCWVEQQKTYGRKCPYLNIEMTRKRGVQHFYGKKSKTCPTNISKDRIDSTKPYSKKNLMFVSWKANAMKNNISPLVAKRFIGFYKERFGDE